MKERKSWISVTLDILRTLTEMSRIMEHLVIPVDILGVQVRIHRGTKTFFREQLI